FSDKKERGLQGGILSPLYRGRRFSFLGKFLYLINNQIIN
ncbi:MAG: hypothetical protein PWP04_1693, partial [Candidatus Atribacteria bacterium]|nr:hypothetical protein [Candidatus Atribacteria bacterium]